MTWTTAKETLRATVATISGVHTKAVVWVGKPDPASSRLVQLDVVKAVQEMPDRKVKTLNAAGTYDVETSSVIAFTVSVHCEDVKGEALELVELVRSGFGWDSTAEALAEAGVTLVAEPGQAIPVPVKIDERASTAWLFEVEFRAEFHRADPKSVGVIEHTHIEGELKKGDADVDPVDVTIDVDR
jgi:hypothetical protein